ncbi:MAG: hypothetical protein OXE40_10140 [Gammaproteobacteria bacterium]|nr:hypothetical protein [Gammaproteobacteria bacterium]
MMNRIGGIYLIAVAVVVAVHTVVEPLYHVSAAGQPYSPFWSILNPLMAVAIVLAVAAAWRCKRAVDQEGGDAPVSRAFLIANTLFFGLLFFGIMYVWNWFNLMSPGFTAISEGTVSLVWIVVDAALPLLWGATGVALLRTKDSE